MERNYSKKTFAKDAYEQLLELEIFGCATEMAAQVAAFYMYKQYFTISSIHIWRSGLRGDIESSISRQWSNSI